MSVETDGVLIRAGKSILEECTPQLRFVEKAVGAQANPSRILQQLWYSSDGKSAHSEWRDVPLVTEEGQ